MAKKQDSFYFDTFITCIDYSCQAAHLLNEVHADVLPAAASRRSWTRCTPSSTRRT